MTFEKHSFHLYLLGICLVPWLVNRWFESNFCRGLV